MRKTGCQEIWAEVCHRFPARFRSSYLILPPDTVSPRDKVTEEFVKGLLNRGIFTLSFSPGSRAGRGSWGISCLQSHRHAPCSCSQNSSPTSSPLKRPDPLASRAHSQREEPPLPALPWQQHGGCGSCRAALQAHALCRDQHFFGQCIVFANGNWQWKKYSGVKGLI